MGGEGRKVTRDEHGRPAIQVVGFRLSPTFELLSRDSPGGEIPRVVSAEYASPADHETVIERSLLEGTQWRPRQRGMRHRYHHGNLALS